MEVEDGEKEGSLFENFGESIALEQPQTIFPLAVCSSGSYVLIPLAAYSFYGETTVVQIAPSKIISLCLGFCKSNIKILLFLPHYYNFTHFLAVPASVIQLHVKGPFIV